MCKLAYQAEIINKKTAEALCYGSSFMAFWPILGLRPPLCQGFDTIEFLRSEDVSAMPNSQLETLGYLWSAHHSKPVWRGYPMLPA
jgi:hypothetical protein